MASRNTQQEAQELKERFEASYPDLSFKITDLSKTREIPRALLQKSQQIVEDNGGDKITILDGYFLVREVRVCEKCGGEILTAAIGEIEVGGNYCGEKCKPQIAHTGSADFDAYCQAEAQYYAEEGSGPSA